MNDTGIRGYLSAHLRRAEAGVWYGTVPQGIEVGRGAVTLDLESTERWDGLWEDGTIIAQYRAGCWAERRMDAYQLAAELARAVQAIWHSATDVARWEMTWGRVLSVTDQELGGDVPVYGRLVTFQVAVPDFAVPPDELGGDPPDWSMP